MLATAAYVLLGVIAFALCLGLSVVAWAFVQKAQVAASVAAAPANLGATVAELQTQVTALRTEWAATLNNIDDVLAAVETKRRRVAAIESKQRQQPAEEEVPASRSEQIAHYRRVARGA